MTLFLGLIAVGFVVAVVIGSVAWYNSKRPAGWENAERPGWVKAITPKDLKEREGDQ
jgi:hypothetical protein